MDDSCIFSLKMFFFGSTSSILGKLTITIVVISVNQLTILNFLAHFLKTSKISIIFVWLNWELVYLLKTCWNCAVSSPMWPPDPDIKYDFKKKVAIFWISRYTHGTRWWPLTFWGIFWCFSMPISHTKIWKREYTSTEYNYIKKYSGR